MTARDPLAVRCPTCGAAPQNECFANYQFADDYWKVRSPHIARVRAAEREKEGKESEESMSCSDRKRAFESEDAMHVVHALEEQTELIREQWDLRVGMERKARMYAEERDKRLDAEFHEGRRVALVCAALTGMNMAGEVNLDEAIRQADFLMARMYP